MSMAVIGSPLTSATTCCAAAGASGAVTATAATSAAASRWPIRMDVRSVITRFCVWCWALIRITALWGEKVAAIGPGAGPGLEMQPARRIRQAGNPCQAVDALRKPGGAERPQADLHERRMDGLGIGRIAVAGRIGHPDGKAVVDIAEPDIGLVDALGFDVVAQACEQAPVLRQLDRAGAQNGLAA